MIPSRVLLTMASSDESTMAARRPTALSSCSRDERFGTIPILWRTRSKTRDVFAPLAGTRFRSSAERRDILLNFSASVARVASCRALAFGVDILGRAPTYNTKAMFPDMHHEATSIKQVRYAGRYLDCLIQRAAQSSYGTRPRRIYGRVVKQTATRGIRYSTK